MIELSEDEWPIVAAARALVDLSPGPPHVFRVDRALSPLRSAEALALVEEALAVGWVLSMVRRGGWRRQGGGRLWERHDPPGLRFSGFALELCRWLAEAPAGAGLEARPETGGDHLLCYLAAGLSIESGLSRAAARAPGLRASPLVWLAYPELVAGGGAADPPPFELFAEPPMPLLLDALDDDLRRRLIAAERAKSEVASTELMIAIGAVQDAAFAGALAALDGAGRRDLSRFVVAAAAELAASPTDRAAGLELGVSVARRAEARTAAASLDRGLAIIRGWVREARAVRFFDDGYPEAQQMLALWELLGDAGYRRLVAVGGG